MGLGLGSCSRKRTYIRVSVQQQGASLTHHSQLLREPLKPLQERALLRALGEQEVFLFLLLAEISRREQFLQQDDLPAVPCVGKTAPAAEPSLVVVVVVVDINRPISLSSTSFSLNFSILLNA